MSGSTRAITLKLDVQGASQLQADLRAMGAAGEATLARLEAAAQRASGNNSLAKIGTDASNAFGSMTPKIQAAGFQIQDFAVQVQGGTSALTALAQQGSQFLGAFGPQGAIAGAVLTVGILVSKLWEVKSATDEITRTNDLWKKSVADIRDLYESAAEKANRLRHETAQSAISAQSSIMASATQRGEAISGRVMQVETELNAARARRDTMGGTENGTLRQALDRNIADLERRLASLRGDADMAQREVEAAREQITRAQNAGTLRDENGYPNFTGERALQDARQGAADARRLRGLTGSDRVAETARIKAEQEAREKDLDGLAREELIRLRVAAALDSQGQAHQKFVEAQESREARRERLLEQLAQRQASAAEQAVEAASPAARALATYEEALRKVEAAQNLFFSTQSRAGGPLGMSPEEAEKARSALTDKWGESLQQLAGFKKEADNTDRAFNGLFAGIESGFERAVTSGAKFGDILKSLEQDIAKVILRLGVTGPLSDALTSAFKGFNVGNLGAGIGDFYTSTFKVNSAGSSTLGLSSPEALMAALPAGPSRYANGGIMTEFGPLPLRKYAGGGVANSPQVAIYGEARKPEAYVPLPDGRSIPVTMQGGGGSTINIDARGAEAGVEQKIRMVLAQHMPAIIGATRADLTQRVNRGGSDAQTFGRR